MSRKNDIAAGLLAGATGDATEAHVQQDAQNRARDAKRKAKAGADAGLPLDRIHPRPGGDTRPPDPGHVLDLAENIAVLGLLEPLVVDRAGRLIAGANRLAALRLLAADTIEDRATFLANLSATSGRPISKDASARLAAIERPDWITDPIPVRTLAFDAVEDPEAAVSAEITENVQRRNYEPTEVRGFLDRLTAAGFTLQRGRPKAGDRPALPALAVLIGRSRRRVLAMLQEAREAEGAETKPPEPSPHSELAKALRAAEAAVQKHAATLERELLGVKGKGLSFCRELASGLSELRETARKARDEIEAAAKPRPKPRTKTTKSAKRSQRR